MKEVKFGIIGLGIIARRFAAALARTDGAVLYGAAARDLSRAEGFAQEYGAEKTFGSYDALIADKNIDVIYIALPHSHHYGVIKKCLEQRKAVLCEKPMVLTEAEATELKKLAKLQDTLLVEAMWTRMLPAVRKAKEWVADGKIGPLKWIMADFCGFSDIPKTHRMRNPDLAGGAMWDIGVYPIEFITGIVGCAPESIHSTAIIETTGVDDTTSVMMQFPGGVIGNAVSSYQTTSPCDAFIYGREGYIRVPQFFNAVQCDCYNREHELLESFHEPCDEGFLHEAAHIRDLFLQGAKESPLIPLDDTIACCRIFEQAKKQWKR